MQKRERQPPQKAVSRFGISPNAMALVSAPILPPALQTESDVVLLHHIARRDHDPTLAAAAFQIFYDRYRTYLAAVARSVCRHSPGAINDTVDFIFQNTFIQVFEHAGTFNTEKIKAADLAAGVKAWLGKIADNEHKQLLRQQEKTAFLQIVEDVSVFESGQESDPENDPHTEPVSHERQLLEQALGTLNEKERYILIRSRAYEQDGKNLPSEFLDSTCQMFSITRANFRKIKSLAFQKVKNKIAELQALHS